MVGAVIGSASIVLVVTVMLTGKHYVIGPIEAAGSNPVFAEMPLTPSVSTALSDEMTPRTCRRSRRPWGVVRLSARPEGGWSPAD